MSDKSTKSTKLDKTVKHQEAVIDGLKDGATITDACKAAGIERTIYYLWCVKEPEFAKKAEAAKDSRIYRVEDALFKSALDGNVTAQIYFLQNRASDKWQDKRAVDLNARGAINLIIGKQLKDV